MRTYGIWKPWRTYGIWKPFFQRALTPQFHPITYNNFIVILFCPPIGSIDLNVVRNVQTVCPGDLVALNCSVRETRFLVWSVNSTQITCLGNANAGDGCLNGGNGLHAIITNISHDSRSLANITSLLVISNIQSQVNVSCEDQVARAQEILRVASTWTGAFYWVVVLPLFKDCALLLILHTVKQVDLFVTNIMGGI